MTYTPHKPPLPESTDELRRRIPGWGVDLDPADRPAVPKLQYQEDFTGAHWEFPERQVEHVPRERSIEHGMLTPVFGTAQPLRGVSGAVRRHAYRYSEGRTAHWLLLVLGDRVDAWGHHLTSLGTLHPDNPITETGVRAEFTHHGLRSRRRQHRTDLRHHLLDPVVVGGPWIAAGWAVYAAARGVARVVARR